MAKDYDGVDQYACESRTNRAEGCCARLSLDALSLQYRLSFSSDGIMTKWPPSTENVDHNNRNFFSIINYR